MENVIKFCNEYLTFHSRNNLSNIRKRFETKRTILSVRYKTLVGTKEVIQTPIHRLAVGILCHTKETSVSSVIFKTS